VSYENALYESWDLEEYLKDHPAVPISTSSTVQPTADDSVSATPSRSSVSQIGRLSRFIEDRLEAKRHKKKSEGLIGRAMANPKDLSKAAEYIRRECRFLVRESRKYMELRERVTSAE
jgi:hypothetical protein